MPDATLTPEQFIEYWTKAEANERANSHSFLIGLTQLLGVPQPAHNHHQGYSFEHPIKVPGGDSTNFIDLYRRGHFVLESNPWPNASAPPNKPSTPPATPSPPSPNSFHERSPATSKRSSKLSSLWEEHKSTVKSLGFNM